MRDKVRPRLNGPARVVFGEIEVGGVIKERLTRPSRVRVWEEMTYFT